MKNSKLIVILVLALLIPALASAEARKVNLQIEPVPESAFTYKDDPDVYKTRNYKSACFSGSYLYLVFRHINEKLKTIGVFITRIDSSDTGSTQTIRVNSAAPSPSDCVINRKIVYPYPVVKAIGNNIFVFWADNTENNNVDETVLWFNQSPDGGINWLGQKRIGNLHNTGLQPIKLHVSCTQSAEDINIYILLKDPATNEMFVYSSLDSGKIWSYSRPLFHGDSYFDIDSFGKNVHIMYKYKGESIPFLLNSNDGGKNWNGELVGLREIIRYERILGLDMAIPSSPPVLNYSNLKMHLCGNDIYISGILENDKTGIFYIKSSEGKENWEGPFIINKTKEIAKNRHIANFYKSRIDILGNNGEDNLIYMNSLYRETPSDTIQLSHKPVLKDSYFKMSSEQDSIYVVYADTEGYPFLRLSVDAGKTWLSEMFIEDIRASVIRNLIPAKDAAYMDFGGEHKYLAVIKPYKISGVHGTVFERIEKEENAKKTIAGAIITFTNIKTGVDYNTISNEDGSYEINLSPGEYNGTAKKEGFVSPEPISGIIVKEGEFAIADLFLKITEPPPPQPPENHAPELAAIGNKSIDEGALLEFNVTATDADGDKLTYSAEGLPSGAVFDPATGRFSWTPGNDHAGDYKVTFKVTDGKLEDSETISITVNNVNRGPELAVIGNKTVDENSLLEFTITAADPDKDILTYSAEGLPNGALFDSATCKFSWTPGFDQAGDYKVTFKVSDGKLEDSETISITVNNVNRAPELAAIGNKIIDEGALLEFIVTATDADNDKLTYSADGLPNGALFDPVTGKFSWKPGFEQAGNCKVTFKVSDGKLEDSETISITVNNVNRAPELAAIGNKIIDEGALLEFIVTATDADNDKLTYSADGLPSGALFDSATGEFSWTPTEEQLGDFIITFSVSDGQATDSETITITVKPVFKDSPSKPFQEEAYNTEGIEGCGVTVTDGMYLYTHRWSDQYPGPVKFTKIGTGYNGTEAGKNYGETGPDITGILSAACMDNCIYYPISNAYKLGRLDLGTGKTSMVNVSDGLVANSTGALTNNYQLITTDGRYIYNLAYGAKGTAYTGWAIRKFDPRNNFRFEKETIIETTSYYTDGVVADGRYVYPIQWTGGNNAMVSRIDIEKGKIINQWTLNQGETDGINGQYDPKNNKFWLGALRKGRVYKYTAFGILQPQAPFLAIKEPKDGDKIGNTAEIKIEFKSLVGIDKIEFYLDDKLLHTETGVTGNELTYNLDARELEEGIYRIKVTATDKSNLSTACEIMVGKGVEYKDSPSKPFQEEAYNTEGIEGCGVTVTDGMYLYTHRWSDQYPGPVKFTKIGTGYSGTEAGKNYGETGPDITGILSAACMDNYIYYPLSNAYKLGRIDLGTGKESMVDVPDGLVASSTGILTNSYQLITTDGRFIYNLAYGTKGGAYKGWVIRKFDPRNNFKFEKETIIETTSYYTDGILADGRFVYAIEWTGGNNTRVIRFDIEKGKIINQWTLNQGETDAINGQYDDINNKFWLGALRKGMVYRYTAFGGTITKDPNIEIVSPGDKSIIDELVEIKAKFFSSAGVKKIDFYVNDSVINTIPEKELSGNEAVYSWDTKMSPKGEYAIRVEITDKNDKKEKHEITVKKETEPEFYSPSKPFQEEVVRSEAAIKSVTVVTDGMYLYIFGEENISIIGSGYNNTVQGQSYGTLPLQGKPVSAACMDGFIYYTTGDPYRLYRLEITTGKEKAVSVPDGLLEREKGTSEQGTYYITTDGRYIINLSYHIPVPAGDTPGTNGWSVKIFDPRDGFKPVNKFNVAVESYPIGGLLCDGMNIYPIESKGDDSARVSMISIKDTSIKAQWTINQGETGVANGQIDYTNNKFWLSAKGNSQVYRYTASGPIILPAPSVDILAPNDNAIVQGLVDIQVRLKSQKGISKVEFYINDSLVHTIDDVKGEEVVYSWDTSGLSDGAYNIKVVATDVHDQKGEDKVTVGINVNLIDTPSKPTQELEYRPDKQIIQGAGVLAADGKFLFVKRYSNYVGSDTFIKVGSGYNGTKFQRVYGIIGPRIPPIISACYYNGYIYFPLRNEPYKIAMLNVETGVISSAAVPAGLITRDSGKVEPGWHLITTDGRVFYNISHHIHKEEITYKYNGWTIRVFDPENNFSLVYESTAGEFSYKTNGLLADGKYIRLIEWTGDNKARVTRIDPVTGVIFGEWTINQGDTHVNNGQCDYVNDKFFLGSLTDNGIFMYTGLDPSSPPPPPGTPNNPPSADAQNITTDEDTAVNITLTAVDPEGAVLAYSIVSEPLNGKLTGIPPDAIYTPNLRYTGPDSFSFKTNDGEDDSNTAVISLTVNRKIIENKKPIADPKEIETSEDTPVQIILSGSDPDGDPITYNIVTGTSHGTLYGTPPAITYTPEKDYNGSDAFTYNVNDGKEDSDLAIVTIKIAPVNDSPVAYSQTVRTDKNTSIQITLKGSDPEGAALAYTIVSGPSHGSLGGTPPALIYTPDNEFSGADMFEFKVNDGENDSNTAQVNIAVDINPPTADNQSVVTDEDMPVVIVLTGSDPDGDPLVYSIVSQPSNGTLAGDPPNLTYTPSKGYYGSDTFSFKVNDGIIDSNTATVSITINVVNTTPTADPQEITTDEDTAKDIVLTGTDPDGDQLTHKITIPPEHGTIQGTPLNIKYLPAKDFFGADSFTFVVNDGIADSDPAVVNITVNPVADTPVADLQSVIVDKNQLKQIKLTGQTPDGKPLEYIIVSQPGKGTLSGTPPDVTYTPNNNFIGTDKFSFKVTDGAIESQSVEVSIMVRNNNPVADGQNVSTDRNKAVAITLTGSDPDNDQLEFIIVTAPSNGDLSGTPPNIIYTPDPEYHGRDQFAFKITDGTADSLPATVNVLVDAANTKPIADSQSVSTDEEIPIRITLTGSDPEGYPITFKIAVNPSNGSISGDAPNITYTPKENYNGIDSFTFTVNDGIDDSLPGTVNITVNPVPDAVVLQKIGDKTVDEEKVLSFALSVTEPDGDKVTATVSELPSGAIFNPETMTFSWKPGYNQAGVYSVTFTVTDGTSTSSDTIIITVNDINQPPELDAIGNKNIKEGEELIIRLNASDIDNDTLTYTAVNMPMGASFEPKEKTFTWTPGYVQSGTYPVTFTVEDGRGLKDSETVTINVENTNQPPVIEVMGNTEIDENTTLSLTVEVSDADGDSVQLTCSQLPQGAVFDTNTNTLTWTPDYFQSGAYNITFTAADGELTTTKTVTITVRNVNRGPELTELSNRTIDEGHELKFTVTATEPDNENLAFTGINMPRGATISPQGEFSWTPDYTQAGVYENITISVTDGTDTDSKTFSITVNNVNRGPVADGQSIVIEEDKSVQITLTGTDPDGGALSYILVSQPQNGTLTGTPPNLTYVPNENYNGMDSFTFKVNDGESDSDTAVIYIETQPANDRPIAHEQTVSTNEDIVLELTLTGFDVDGDAITCDIVTEPTHGVLIRKMELGGQQVSLYNFTYTPAKDFTGTDEFIFKVNDGKLDSPPKTITINVNSVNDAPFAENVSTATDEDTPVSIILRGSDPEGSSLNFRLISGPSRGTIIGTSPNFVYTPQGNYNGNDSFSFVANDGSLDSAQATADIAINPVNDTPVFNIIDAQTVDEGKLLTFTLSAVDADGDTMRYQAKVLPAGARFNSQTGLFEWTPNYRQAGEYTIGFTVSDGQLTDDTEVKITVKDSMLQSPAQASVEEKVEVKELEPVVSEINTGIVVTDGTYLYAHKKDGYGKWAKIGTGINNTEKDKLYGYIGPDVYAFSAALQDFNIYFTTQRSDVIGKISLNDEKLSLEDVPEGLIERASGKNERGKILITTDGRYIYNLAYNETSGFNRWTILVLDPRAGFSRVKKIDISAGTYTTEGMVADGIYIYAIEGGDNPRVTRISIEKESVIDQWYLNPKAAGAVDSQFDYVNNSFWLGMPDNIFIFRYSADGIIRYPIFVRITSPKDGEVVSGVVTITADITTSKDIEKVELYVDENLINTQENVNGNTVSFNWDTGNIRDEVYKIAVKAYNTDNQQGVSDIYIGKGPEFYNSPSEPYLEKEMQIDELESTGVLVTDGEKTYAHGWSNLGDNRFAVIDADGNFVDYFGPETEPIISAACVDRKLYYVTHKTGPYSIYELDIKTGLAKQLAVPDGIIEMETGTVKEGWYQITTDGRYIYNTAHTKDGTGFNGWTVRVFDQRNGFRLVRELKIEGHSYYTGSTLCDGRYLYFIELSSIEIARIRRFHIDDGRLKGEWVIDQKRLGRLGSGQYDSINNKFILGEKDNSNIRVFTSAGITHLPIPDVTITSPEKGSEVRGQVDITAGFVSNINIEKTEFYINNELVSTINNPGLEAVYRWNVPADEGIYRIKVKAIDENGQPGSDEIVVGKGYALLETPKETTQQFEYLLGNIGGAGIVTSDGEFLYVKRSSNYPGTDDFRKIGTGYGMSIAGEDYGTIGPRFEPIISACWYNGGIWYAPRAETDKLVRIDTVTGGTRTVTVPEGILARHNGKVDIGYKLITTDGLYFYNLSHHIDGGGNYQFNGWSVRVFNPADNWRLINQFTVGNLSCKTNGFFADGRFIYMLEWTNDNSARITRADLRGNIIDRWTINQGITKVNNGQFDSRNKKFFIGSLTRGTVYMYRWYIDSPLPASHYPPEALNQRVTTVMNTPVDITLTGFDRNGDELTYILETYPVYGTLTINASVVTYTPEQDYIGQDSFTFKANDGKEDSNTAVVSIDVTRDGKINRSPVALGQEVTTNEDENAAIELKGTDPDENELRYIIITGPAHGSLEGTPPSLTYIPEPNYFGIDSFTFIVNDGAFDSEPAEVNITVKPVDDAPVLIVQSQQISTDKNTPVQFTLQVSDIENDELVCRFVLEPQHGSVETEGMLITYTPNEGYAGTEFIKVLVFDGALNSDVADIFITVLNKIPKADAKQAETNEDTPVVITLTGTDEDAGEMLSFEVKEGPEHGTLSGVTPEFTYTPAQDYFGADSFTYAAKDGTDESHPATVTITVNKGENDVPVAEPQTLKILMNEPLQIKLSGIDPDGDGLVFMILSGPSNGTLEGEPPDLIYTPAVDFFGEDQITFKVNDGVYDSAPAVISITVKRTNKTPVANPQDLSTVEDTTINITLTGSDPDSEDTLVFKIVNVPGHGAITGEPPNITYTPEKDYTGEDSFTFIVNDGLANSEPAIVKITMTPVNDAPVADAQSLTTSKNRPLQIALTVNDADKDTLSFAIVEPPKNGTLQGELPNPTYTPNQGFVGKDEFSFKANDGTLDSNTAVITITVENHIPVVKNIETETDEETPVNIILEATDEDEDELVYSIVKGPQHGILSGIVKQDNRAVVTYTPNRDFFGKDSFEFKANDGTADSEIGTANINVKIINDKPAGDSQSVETDEDTPLEITLTGSDSDGEPLSFRISSQPRHGSLGGTAPDLTYTPPENYCGDDSFSFIVNDAREDSEQPAWASIKVKPVNDIPVLADIGNKTLNENELLTIQLKAEDIDKDILVYSVDTLPGGAELDSAKGIFRWKPGYEQAGEYIIKFTAADNESSDEETITIQVNDKNRPPVITIEPEGDTKQVDEMVELAFTVSAMDPDGGNVTLSVRDLPDGAVFDSQTGRFTWTPRDKQNGVYPVIFTAVDEMALSADKTVTITVVNTNKPPELASIGNKSADENTELRFTISGSDPEGSAVTFSARNLPSGASISPQGEFLWTPNYDQAGTHRAIFVISDGELEDTEDVEINVNNINRGPVLGPIENKTVPEDAALEFLVNANDPDNDRLSYILDNYPPGAVIDQNGMFRWTPNFEQAGIYEKIKVIASDGTETASQELTITVNNVNRIPDAEDLNLEITEDNPALFILPARDLDGNQLSYTISDGPSHGRLSGTAPHLTYTPNTDFFGDDSFKYKANDRVIDSRTSTVNIKVIPENDTPVAHSQEVGTCEDKPVPITLTGEDKEGSVLTIADLTNPSHGSLTGEAHNLTYTPSAGFTGNDEFTFRVNDGQFDSEPAMVTIVVLKLVVLGEIGDRSVHEGNELTIQLQETASRYRVLVYSFESEPALDGAVIDSTTGLFKFTPHPRQSGEYHVTFSVTDGISTDSETITLTVIDVPLPPVERTFLMDFNLLDQSIAGMREPFGAWSDNSKGAITNNRLVIEPDKSVEFQTIPLSGRIQKLSLLIHNEHVNNPNPAWFRPAKLPMDNHTLTLEAEDEEGRKITLFTNVYNDENQNVEILFNWDSRTVNGQYIENMSLLRGKIRYKIKILKSFVGGGSYGALLSGIGYVDNISFITSTPGDDEGAQNHPPVIGTLENKTIIEGESFSYTVPLSDPDGDRLTITVEGLPRGLFFLSRGPNKILYSPDYDQAGVHEVTITASDGNLTDTKKMQITVLEGNEKTTTGIWYIDSGLRDRGYIISRNVGEPQGEVLFINQSGHGRRAPYEVDCIVYLNNSVILKEFSLKFRLIGCGTFGITCGTWIRIHIAGEEIKPVSPESKSVNVRRLGNIFHTIKIHNLDFKNNTCDISLNNVVVKEDAPINPPTTIITTSRFYLIFRGSLGQGVEIDDIEIKY